MKKDFILMAAILFICELGMGQDFTLPLWQENIPNYQKTDEVETRDTTDIVIIRNVQNPDISVYLPAGRNANGQAVVICPGGGYAVLAYDWEGANIASLLNAHGIAAVVLKYRLPGSESNIVRHLSPLLDAQRAIRLTRYHAAEWHIEDDQIGIMGFSAGGHLASTAGTHFDSGDLNSEDPVEKFSSRPDFMILMYPVITFTQSFMHRGSRNTLLGESPDPSLIEYYSNELQVGEETPPTFLIHAGDDQTVPVENSLVFYQALQDKGVAAEMHIYPEGGHGFSLATGNDHLHTWTARCIDWLKWLKQP